MNDGGETYEHADLVVAAVLKLKGFEEATMIKNGDQVVWTYAKTAELKELLFEIHTGSCLVEPQAFSRALRAMRQRVFELMGTDRPRVARAS